MGEDTNSKRWKREAEGAVKTKARLTTASTRRGYAARNRRPHALSGCLVAKALSRTRRAGEAAPFGGLLAPLAAAERDAR